MRTLLMFFVATLAGISFSACHGDATSQKAATSDSLKASQSPEKVNFKSNDLIQPPDSDYTGDYIDRYKNGVIKFRGDFRFGKRHGQWIAFYLNGEKWSECFYNKGAKEGASNIYYPSGKIQMTGWYKNDQADSLWTFYDTLGKVIQTIHYMNGIEIPSGKSNPGKSK